MKFLKDFPHCTASVQGGSWALLRLGNINEKLQECQAKFFAKYVECWKSIGTSHFDSKPANTNNTSANLLKYLHRRKPAFIHYIL